MKQFFSKIAAVFMAIVVVLSTLSFAYSEHFCGDYLVDAALFSKAEACGMEMELAAADKDCNTIKKDCCSDNVQQIEGQTQLKLEIPSFSFEQQQFITAFAYTFLNAFNAIESNYLPYKNYSPPLVEKNIAVLYQVFRI
jgi:hypothetical protein